MIKLSVLMPVYNGLTDYPDGMLENSIKSILTLTKELELIIIDDGSTDATPEFLHGLNAKLRMQGDRRLVILQQYDNRGQAFVLNKGLQIAKGKYIWQWSVRARAHPIAKKMIDELDNNKEVGFVYGKMLSYGGWKDYTHTPPKEFDRQRFIKRYLANFYMFRKVDDLEYMDYMFTSDNKNIGISDRDMLMQLMDKGLTGKTANDLVVLYYNGGKHSYDKMKEHRAEIDTIFNERWEHLL